MSIFGFFQREPDEPPPWKAAPPPSSLRNKAGGLARVRVLRDGGSGASEMDGSFVTTVRLDESSFWVIDPPLQFVARGYFRSSSGEMASPGRIATVHAMHDDSLVPVPPVSDEERSEEMAFHPTAPRLTVFQP
jgi:hypothetical protein